ncbi:hypothetical protein ES703_109751 [subsurface metagenome]
MYGVAVHLVPQELNSHRVLAYQQGLELSINIEGCGTSARRANAANTLIRLNLHEGASYLIAVIPQWNESATHYTSTLCLESGIDICGPTKPLLPEGSGVFHSAFQLP